MTIETEQSAEDIPDGEVEEANQTVNIETEKKEVISLLIPQAVLKPLTLEAMSALENLKTELPFVSLTHFPITFGRDTRSELVFAAHHIVVERRQTTIKKSNNDIYLIDREKYVQIAREHFAIDQLDNNYFLIDRKSESGLLINNEHLSTHDENREYPLVDGDIIGVGKNETSYLFKFLILTH